MKALNPLFKKNKKWITIFGNLNNPHVNKNFPNKNTMFQYQWGLEKALDILLPKNKIVVVNSPVWTQQPFRKSGITGVTQELARLQINKELLRRKEMAESIIKKRRELFKRNKNNRKISKIKINRKK